ncbi:MAG: ABC transporter ATP-binding protein [Chloroflexota bacterium]
MKPEVAISATDLGKMYLLYQHPEDRLKQSLFWRLGKNYARTFWALRQVSFDVHNGEVLGIIGRNGSGKSTLLQLIAGTLQPTEGSVHTNGRLTALLELGAGFNPEFTGRENIFLNGSTLGIREKEMQQKLDAIIDFAQIGEFIDQPVKLYSSGMYVRLAFAIATSLDPEVLIIDEALAVGDVYFQQKCYQRMQEFKDAGKAIVFVTHDAGAVKSLCDRAIWLEAGQIKDSGKPESVVTRYLSFLFGYEEQALLPDQPKAHESGEALAPASFSIPESVIPNINRRYGDGRAELCGIGIYGANNIRIASAGQGQTIQIRISARYKERVESPVFGYILRNRHGLDIASTNTNMEGCDLPPAEAGAIQTVRFRVQLPILAPGAYSLTIGISDGNYLEYVMCDCIEAMMALEILSEQVVFAQMRLPTEVIIE